MAGGKRASMREGPLAALFRRTDIEDAQDEAQQGKQPPQRPEEERPQGTQEQLPAQQPDAPRVR